MLRPEAFLTSARISRQNTTGQNSDIRAIPAILRRVAELNLDISALRLVYPVRANIIRAKSVTSAYLSEGMPSLAFVVRGVAAVKVWGDAVGPDDPLVAKMTDSSSLRAVFGTNRDRNVMRCVCLCFWFAGLFGKVLYGCVLCVHVCA